MLVGISGVLEGRQPLLNKFPLSKQNYQGFSDVAVWRGGDTGGEAKMDELRVGQNNENERDGYK